MSQLLSLIFAEIPFLLESSDYNLHLKDIYIPFENKAINTLDSSEKYVISFPENFPQVERKKLLFTVTYPYKTPFPCFSWSIYQTVDNKFLYLSSSKSEFSDISFKALFDGIFHWTINFYNKDNLKTLLPYPISYIVLFQSLLKQKSIIVHASQVIVGRKVWLFSGPSGRGKTTIGEVFRKAGYKVVNDDKAILKIDSDAKIMCYNAPVYTEALNNSYELEKIFFINHGNENRLSEESTIKAIANLSSNTIQHNFSSENINSLYDVIFDICKKIEIYSLEFKPDINIIHFLNNVFPTT